MNENQTPMPSLSVGLVEKLAHWLKLLPRRVRREPTVVLVEGQECVSVPLTKNMSAIVDASDAMGTIQHNWVALMGAKDGSLWYADRAGKRNGKAIHDLMHRRILGIEDGAIKVDHRNGNGLDNRRTNLRASTRSQNLGNRKKNRNGSSKFKGIHWNKKLKKWRATIRVNGEQFSLGCYAQEIDAALAYDRAAREKWGEFARVNFKQS